MGGVGHEERGREGRKEKEKRERERCLHMHKMSV